jgi:hypothetical protein
MSKPAPVKQPDTKKKPRKRVRILPPTAARIHMPEDILQK